MCIRDRDCSSCKEIYYKASMKDSGIGTATVYRMINILEEIGALSRKNMYKIACGPECEVKNACVIEFDDDTIIELSGKSWNQVVQLGLRACGYSSGHKIKSVTAKSLSLIHILICLQDVWNYSHCLYYSIRQSGRNSSHRRSQ